MGRYKYLIKNIGLMTISNFGSKILSFLLVPLYTSILTTEEYGIYDIYTVTIFLLAPILSLNIVEAVMRFSLDTENDRNEIFSTAIFQYIIAVILCFVFIIVNCKIGIIKSFCYYPIYFVLYFALSLLADLMVQFARGLERLVDVTISGIISSLCTLGCNILFLVVFKAGLEGYFLASCSAFVATAGYLIVRLKAWKYIHVKSAISLHKKMTSYSIPMIFNTVGWWINNVSDKYVVTFLCGAAANGVFSVAYKIPSILTMFQTIFNQAWTISAVKEFDENSSEFYSNIYKVYNFVLVVLCSGLIIFNKLIAKILFANDFYVAWKYAPFLMLAVVFGSLSNLLGGIFAAAKKTKVYGKTTMVGAGVNVIANVGLVLLCGPVGAAIATVLSNIVVWGCRIKEANKIILIQTRYTRNFISYIIVFIQCICMLIIENSIFMYPLEVAFLLIILILYRGELMEFLQQLGKISKKLGKGKR